MADLCISKNRAVPVDVQLPVEMCAALVPAVMVPPHPLPQPHAL